MNKGSNYINRLDITHIHNKTNVNIPENIVAIFKNQNFEITARLQTPRLQG